MLPRPYGRGFLFPISINAVALPSFRVDDIASPGILISRTLFENHLLIRANPDALNLVTGDGDVADSDTRAQSQSGHPGLALGPYDRRQQPLPRHRECECRFGNDVRE